jgi:hypothetical protein
MIDEDTDVIYVKDKSDDPVKNLTMEDFVKNNPDLIRKYVNRQLEGKSWLLVALCRRLLKEGVFLDSEITDFIDEIRSIGFEVTAEEAHQIRFSYRYDEFGNLKEDSL